MEQVKNPTDLYWKPYIVDFGSQTTKQSALVTAYQCQRYNPENTCLAMASKFLATTKHHLTSTNNTLASAERYTRNAQATTLASA